MRRKTFDALMSAGGFLVAVVLLIAGGLLMWGHNFAADNVKTQLSQQKIFFPDKGSPALKADPEIAKYVTPYAGQQVVNGTQAEVFANHYIGVHLREAAGGKTYSEMSALSRANPNDTKMAGQVETLFKGETLRGLLLNAYAFGKLGTIALYGSIVSFVLGGVMLLLALAGMLHFRKASPDAELVLPPTHKAPTPATPVA